MTTEEYLLQWLQTFVEPFRAASTAACYRRAINALPAALAQCPLDQLNGLMIQAHLNTQARKHPRAAQLTFATLHVAMAKAVDLGLIVRTPLSGCVKPQHMPKRAGVLTPEQLAQYIQAAKDHPAFPLLLLMAACGLRRGEALGLMWQDISGDLLQVRRQRIRISGKYQVAPLKSKASARVLPLAAPILEELQAVRVRSFSGWVCDCTPEALRKQHMAALAAAGLPAVTLHGLRHSMATAAAADGCPIKILQNILGHARYQLTADLYADHLQPSNLAPSLANLAGVLMQKAHDWKSCLR